MGMSDRATRRGWARLFVGFCATGLTATAAALSHAPDPLFHDSYEGIAAGPSTDADASRFLTQATFGPTDADIAHLRSVGYQAWLNEQFAAAPSYEMTYLNWVRNTLLEELGQNNRQEAWFLGALGGPDPQYPANAAKNHTDQLRQRVAFALSEIFVISDQNGTLGDFANGMGSYYDKLIAGAFGNFRDVLQTVTLHPAMGVYLNMLGNRRADLSQNLHPDENYAREINQLFTIGLVMLNLDGTPQLASGTPIPTYAQSTITNFAHVFTGWNWKDCDGGTDSAVPPVYHQFWDDQFTGCFPPWNDNFVSNFETPMIAFDTTYALSAPWAPSPAPSYHDDGSDASNDVATKQLLSYPGAANGGVVPNGGTAADDLQFALDNIYNHPNVAPFISKQLIQRLVTSNPSPAYVQRVATVFNANRTSGTQLKSVVQAILLDPEARYGQWWNSDTFGKLREPLLAVTHFWRAMQAVHSCGQDVAAIGTPGTMGYSPPSKYANQPYRYAGWGTAWSTSDTQYSGGVAQAALDANTVFNFFKPSFMPPGEMTTRKLLGPEFQLQTDSIIANSTNGRMGQFFWYDLNGQYDPTNHPGVHCDPNDLFGGVMIDLSQDATLAGSAQGGPTDPSDRLVDAYNHRFMSGQMSPFMRDQLITYLNTIDHWWAWPDGTDWRVQRVNRALYLVLTSPEYMIQK